jgi:hypothetical protein
VLANDLGGVAGRRHHGSLLDGHGDQVVLSVHPEIHGKAQGDPEDPKHVLDHRFGKGQVEVFLLQDPPFLPAEVHEGFQHIVTLAQVEIAKIRQSGCPPVFQHSNGSCVRSPLDFPGREAVW